MGHAIYNQTAEFCYFLVVPYSECPGFFKASSLHMSIQSFMVSDYQWFTLPQQLLTTEEALSAF